MITGKLTVQGFATQHRKYLFNTTSDIMHMSTKTYAECYQRSAEIWPNKRVKLNI